MKWVAHLKNDDCINADGTQTMFVLTILEKNQKARLKFSQGSVSVLFETAEYQETRVKLTNKQLIKLKFSIRNKTGIIVRLNQKSLKMKNCHMNYFEQQDKQLKQKIPLLIICQLMSRYKT